MHELTGANAESIDVQLKEHFQQLQAALEVEAAVDRKVGAAERLSPVAACSRGRRRGRQRGQQETVQLPGVECPGQPPGDPGQLLPAEAASCAGVAAGHAGSRCMAVQPWQPVLWAGWRLGQRAVPGV